MRWLRRREKKSRMKWEMQQLLKLSAKKGKARRIKRRPQQIKLVSRYLRL